MTKAKFSTFFLSSQRYERYRCSRSEKILVATSLNRALYLSHFKSGRGRIIDRALFVIGMTPGARRDLKLKTKRFLENCRISLRSSDNVDIPMNQLKCSVTNVQGPDFRSIHKTNGFLGSFNGAAKNTCNYQPVPEISHLISLAHSLECVLPYYYYYTRLWTPQDTRVNAQQLGRINSYV